MCKRGLVCAWQPWLAILLQAASPGNSSGEQCEVMGVSPLWCCAMPMRVVSAHFDLRSIEDEMMLKLCNFPPIFTINNF